MPPPRVSHLYRTVTLTMVGTVLALSLVLGGLSIFYSVDTTYRDAMDTLDSIMSREAAGIESSLEEVRTLARCLVAAFLDGYDGDVAGGGQEALDRYGERVASLLAALVEASGRESGWLMVDRRLAGAHLNVSFWKDRDGILRRERPYDVYETGNATDDWYADALRDGEHWTDPYYWEPWDARIISYSMAMRNPGGMVGVAGSEFFMDSMVERLASIRIFESGYLVLMNAAFDVIYHPDPSIVNLGTARDGSLAGVAERIAAEPARSGTVEYRMDGKRKLMAWTRLSNGWILAAAPYYDEIFARQRRLSLVILAITVIGFVVSSFLSAWLAGLATRPVMALTDQLERQAITDPLTGAYNRRYFMEAAGREASLAARAGGGFSIVMLDLDHFKAVNDNHGHEAGDAVLVAAVGRIRRTLRAADVLGRLGGEEFYILLPRTGMEDACAAAERLRACMSSEPVRLPTGDGIAVTASLGVCSCEPGDCDLADMLRRVDAAMYRAKQAGRDRVERG